MLGRFAKHRLSRGTLVVEDAATAQLREGALVELRPDTR
jgi:hypothetical protein